MNIDVYIMAGGDQLRWRTGHIKQLMKVDGKKWSVIQRTFALVEKYLNTTPVVVTQNIDISLATGCYSNPDLCGASLCESMSRCIEVSNGDGTLFLLGDVYYTQQAFKNILSVNAPFFGNEVELNVDVYERAMSVLYYASELHQDDPEVYKGKMWNMYYLWAGYDMLGHDFGKDFMLIEDDTCDFDTVEEFKEFRAKGIDDYFES